jgi:hypothetical protein
VPDICVRFEQNWGYFREKAPPPQISKFTEIFLVGIMFMETDRRMEREKDVKNLMGAYGEYVNVPETVAVIIIIIIIIIIIVIIIIIIITCYSW